MTPSKTNYCGICSEKLIAKAKARCSHYNINFRKLTYYHDLSTRPGVWKTAPMIVLPFDCFGVNPINQDSN